MSGTKRKNSAHSKSKSRDWKGFTEPADYYLDKDGILRTCSAWSRPENWMQINQETLTLLNSMGYQLKSAFYLHSILRARVGLSWEECLVSFQNGGKRSAQRRDELKGWSDLKDAFQGRVFGVDKEIDFRTDYDFAVFVWLKVAPYTEQVAFVKEHKRELLRYIQKELSQKPKIMARIGSFGLYRVTSITVTRASEVEFIFSLKESVMEHI